MRTNDIHFLTSFPKFLFNYSPDLSDYCDFQLLQSHFYCTLVTWIWPPVIHYEDNLQNSFLVVVTPITKSRWQLMEVSSRLVVCNCVLLDFDRKWSWVLFQYECRKSAKIASSINLQFYSYGSLSKWKKITSLTGFEPIKKELKFNECVCVWSLQQWNLGLFLHIFWWRH